MLSLKEIQQRSSSRNLYSPNERPLELKVVVHSAALGEAGQESLVVVYFEGEGEDTPSLLPDEDGSALVGCSAVAPCDQGLCVWEARFSTAVETGAGRLLLFVVADDPERESHRVLGVCSLDLRELKSVPRAFSRPLAADPELPGAPSLSMSAHLEKRDKYVRVLSRREEAVGTDWTQEVLQKTRALVGELNSPEPLRRALLDSPLVRDKTLFLLEQVRDMLVDAQQLATGTEPPPLPCAIAAARGESAGATRILCGPDLTRDEYQRAAPVPGLSLTLFSGADSHTLSGFPSRWALWHWAGAVRMHAHDKGMRARALLQVRRGDSGAPAAYVCELSSDLPLELALQDPGSGARVGSVSLRALESVLLSADLEEAQPTAVELGVCAASIFPPSSEGRPLREGSEVSSYLLLRRGASSLRSAVVRGLTPKWLPSRATSLVFGCDLFGSAEDEGFVDAYLFSDGTHAARPVLAGHQRLRVRSLLPDRALQTLIEGGRAHESAHTLDLAAGVQLLMRGAERLQASQGELLVQASLVGRDEAAQPHRLRTRRTAACASPVWEEALTFRAPDCALWAADHVLVEVLAHSFPGGDSVLCSLRLPVADIGLECELSLQLSSSVCADAGTLRLCVHKLSDRTQSRTAVTVVARAHSRNCFNTMFPCDAVPADALGEAEAQLQVERYEATPAVGGLALFRPGAAASRERRRSSMGLALQSVARDAELVLKTRIDGADVVLQSFENQRRSLLPPFAFSAQSLTRTDPPKFSDESGVCESDFMSTAPAGFEWAGDWILDKVHCACDQDGWIYDSSFGKLFENYKKGKTSGSPAIGAGVRRRRWVRCANKAVESEDESDDERAVGSRSDDLEASAVDASDAAFDKSIPRARILERHLKEGSRRVLSLCRDARACGDVLVPWSRVKHVRLCSASILALTATVSEYRGQHSSGAEEFEDAEVHLFITSCSALALRQLVLDRMQLQPLREDVLSLVRSTRHGRSKTEVMRTLDGQLSELEDRLARLDQLPIGTDKGRIAALDSERSSLLAVMSRIRLYVAAMIVHGIENRHDFTVETALALLAEDRAAVGEASDLNEEELVARRLLALVEAMHMRVQDACVSGWLYRGAALQRYLECLLNGYLQEIAGMLNQVMAEKATHIESIAQKKTILDIFLSNNSKLERILFTVLTPLGYAAAPPPRLALTVEQHRIFEWYNSGVNAVFETNLAAVFQKWKRSSESVHLPWKANRVWSSKKVGKFSQTTLPEDCIASLKTDLSAARLASVSSADEFASLVANVNSNSELLFVDGLISLARFYRSTITSRDWLADHADDALLHDKLLMWLFSFINDISRVQVGDLVSRCVADNADACGLDRHAVSKLEKIEEANSVLEKAYVNALDVLSCTVFAKLFANFESEWPAQSNVPHELGRLSELVLNYSSALMDMYSSARLLLICADKIVVLYLALIRDGCERGQLRFESDLLIRFALDVRHIQEAFAEVVKAASCGKYAVLIELRLRRLDDVLTLVGDKNEDKVKAVLQRVSEEGLCKHPEALAYANMIKACVKARQMSASPALLEMINASVEALTSVYSRPVAALMLVERSPESRVFDVEGSHSRLPVGLLLRKSALSSEAQTKLLETEDFGVDSGPCWSFESLFYSLFKPKVSDISRHVKKRR